MGRCFCKCSKCGATSYASWQSDTQGDGVMTGEIFVIEDFDGWEGGDVACSHDDHAEIISVVDPDYD